VKAIKRQCPEAYSRLRGRYRFTEKSPPPPLKRERGWGEEGKERKKRK